MASGPYPDPRRGTWAIQWFDGVRWRRTVVVKKPAGWKLGQPMPKTPPPAAKAALAEFIAKEAAARRRKGYQPDRPIGDFLRAYLDGYGVGREPASKVEAVKAVDIFLAWCAAHKVATLENVAAEICHRWMDERAATIAIHTKKPIAYATLKKERALLATAWSEALRRGQVDRNPWLTVEVPGKAAKKKRGSWSPEEFGRLIAASNPWLRDFLVVGCYTGFRVEALQGIEWRDVRPPKPGGGGHGYLVVRPELDKTGKGYEVPIHAKVNEVIMRRFIHSRGGHERILSGMQGKPIGSGKSTGGAIILACAKAGLKKPDSPNHHCRRTFGRWAILGHLIGRPVPMYVVSRWLGHSSLKMTQEYLDMGEADSTEWMTASDDFMNNSSS